MISWIKTLFASRGAPRPKGFIVKRGSEWVYMGDVDKELCDRIGHMPIREGLSAWCAKYPDDNPICDRW